MIYRTTKCPYCQYILESRVTYDKGVVGPSLLPCPNCRKLYKTGMKFWNEMSNFQQKRYYIGGYTLGVIRCIFRSAMIGFLPIGIILSGIFKVNDHITLTIGTILSIIVFPFFLNNYFRILKENAEIDFEEFLYYYWKKYKNFPDDLLEQANYIADKNGFPNYYDFEKEILKDKNYDYKDIKYFPFDERLNWLAGIHGYDNYEKMFSDYNNQKTE